MPEVFRHYGFRFFFFSREAEEPVHVHVESAEKYAKFWVEPLMLAESYGFRSGELKQIRELIESNSGIIREKWNEHIDRHRKAQG